MGKNLFRRKEQFSIRKLSLGVASVMIGASLVAGAEVKASDSKNVEVHYVVENDLTDAEKAALKKFEESQKVEEDVVAYYYVYKPKSGSGVLPNTGSAPLKGVAIAGTSLLVLAIFISKRKNKLLIMTAFSVGLSGVLGSTVLAKEHFSRFFENVDVQVGGKLPAPKEIDGYTFTGYYFAKYNNKQDNAVVIPEKPVEPTKPEQPTEPEKPVEPTKPEQPTEPEKPVEPTKPEQPTEPEKPVEPIKPEQPTEPEKPVEPTKPEQPTEPEKPVEPTKPEQPTEPEKPVEPTKPEQPTEPEQPVEPTKPEQPTEPEKPVEPTKPEQPTEPEQPVEPTKPEQPTEPEQPVEPTKPEQPTEPEKPVEPTKPEQPTEPEKPVEPTKPEQPTEPEKPVEPIKPEQPTEPEKPVEPTKPEQPTEPEKPVEPTKPEQPTEPEKPIEGTVDEVTTVEIPFSEEMKTDDTKFVDEVTVTPGENGTKTVTTTYKTINGKKINEIISMKEVVTKEPVNKVTTTGTKPLKVTETVIENEEIAFETIKTTNPEKYTDEENVVDGENGLVKVTYSVTKDNKTGEVLSKTEVSREVVTQPVNKVVEVGTKAIEGQETDTSTESIPFKTITQQDDTLKAGEEVVVTEGVAGEKEITKVYKTIKGVREKEPQSTTEKIIKEPVDKVVKVGTKVLNKKALEDAISLAKSKNKNDFVESTFSDLLTQLTSGETEYSKENTTQEEIDKATAELLEKIAKLELKAPEYTNVVVEKNDLKKSVTLDYTLSNPQNNYISGKVNMYKDGNLVATKNIDNNKAIFDGLDYDVEYVFKPEITYNNNLTTVSKEQTTNNIEKTVELSLKKLEFKEITAVELYRRDNNGTEFTKLSDLSEMPTALGNYYAKIKSDTFKEVMLPVSKVEETTKDGKQYFKFTTALPELVQGENIKEYAEGYSFIIDKFVPAQNNIYYSIKELIAAMNKDKSGTYILGNNMDMSSLTLEKNQVSYVTGEFTGKLVGKNGDNQFAFYGSTLPLFETLKGATVENVVLKDVNINGGQDLGGLAKTADNTKITNVAVKGNINGTRNIGGIVSSAKNSTRLEQVDFSGKITSPANTGGSSKIGGLVGLLDDSYINKGHAKIDINLNQASNNSYATGGLVAQVTRQRWLNTVHVKDSYVEGTITNTGGGRVAGIVTSNWTNGVIENVLSDVKVTGGNIVYSDTGALGTNHRNVMKNFYVTKNATGEQTELFKPTELTDEQATEKVNSFGLENIGDKVVDQLSKNNEYKVDYSLLPNYNVANEINYKNIAKLMPFYNKEQIIKYGNKLSDSNKLHTTEILSVVPMKDNEFISNYNNEINKVLVHYKDGTKEYYTLSNKQANSKAMLDEYNVGDLGVIYTPNQFIQDYSPIVSVVVSDLKAIDLYSDSVAEVLGIGSDTAKEDKLKKLYYDEQFKDTKENIEKYLTNILTSSSVLRTDNAVTNEHTIQYIKQNKEALLLGITYMNRLYNINFGDVNIREIMANKMSEFYGKTENPLEFLVKLGNSQYSTLLISSNVGTYRSSIAPTTGKETIIDFLDYNRKLFTDMDKYAWFSDATKDHLYIAERSSEVPEIANAEYKAYDKLQKAEFINYILPLLTMQKSNLYIISNYSTLVFGSKDRKPNETQDNWLRSIDESADNFRNYIDNWYRIANDDVKQRLVKERNLPIWDGYNANGWADQFGRYGEANEFKSLREFFGPIGKWFGNNGLGAYALIGTRTPLIHFIVGDVLTDYGQSIFSHEVTHVYDDSIYLGGFGRRTGMGPEAYAQGLLQIPRNGGELGVNLMFTYPNDGTRWYNPRSDVFGTQADIDKYMKRYIDTLMVLDHAEADGVIATGNKEFMNGYYKKMDKQLKSNGLDQLDLIRDLNEDEKAININSIDDLINNNFMTKFQLGNGTYDGNGVNGDSYVTPHMMLAIYGGNTSTQGAGAAMFKHNAFHIWGYYGYSNGFVGYTSTKYGKDAKADGEVLGDKYVIKKISNGKFETLEQWKVAYYNEVKQKANSYFRPVTVNGKTISSYDQLQKEFNAIANANIGNPSRAITQIINFKSAVYKAWLKDTEGFQSDIVGNNA